MSRLHDLNTTLITGASAGIGLSLAKVFAQHGHDLVLVARRREKLEEIATELQTTYDVQVHVIACDLSEPDASLELFAKTQAQDLQIDILINNAGLGQSGPFSHMDMSRITSMLRVNVEALVQLTRLYLEGMVDRNKGAILQVGSTAGFQSGPNMAVYYATKAFVLSFNDALVEEVRGTRVTVSNLCPGATSTEFQEAADIDKSWLFATGVATADSVALAGFNGLSRGTSIIVPGASNKLGALSAKLVPRPALRRIVGKLNSDRE